MVSFAKRAGQCLSLLPLIALFGLTGGCAGSLPDRLLDARTGAYVFHHPAPVVESTARALLNDNGFYLIAVDKGGIIRTSWRPVIDDDQFATTFERYVIVIKRLTPEHCRVEAIKISASTLGSAGRREGRHGSTSWGGSRSAVE